MDALCICKNGIHQLAAALIPSTGMGFDLNWYGDAKQGIAIYVTRSDELASQDRWKDLQILVGDKLSLVTREANSVDEPIESFAVADRVNQAKANPKMKPAKQLRPPLREIGILDCHINNKPLFSFHLTTDNMLSVGFVWLGDRFGRSLVHIGWDSSSKPIIPKIAFGDEVTFLWRRASSTICSSAAGPARGPHPG